MGSSSSRRNTRADVSSRQQLHIPDILHLCPVPRVVINGPLFFCPLLFCALFFCPLFFGPLLFCALFFFPLFFGSLEIRTHRIVFFRDQFGKHAPKFSLLKKSVQKVIDNNQFLSNTQVKVIGSSQHNLEI